MVAFSRAVVPVCASIIFRAKALTSGDRALSTAILPAATSYMSLIATALAKPWVDRVISAENSPTTRAVESFTALMISEAVPGLEL